MAFDTGGSTVSGFVPPSVSGVRSMAYDEQSDTIYASGTAGVVAFKPSGTIVALAANPFAQTASPDAIAAVGVDPMQGGSADTIAVANDATVSIDYYHADGTYITSDVLTAPPAAAPIAGLVWSPPSLGAPMLVSGGTAAAGFAFAENVGGGPAGSPVASATTRFGQIAIDSTIMHEVPSVTNNTLGEVFVVQPDSGKLQGYALDSGDSSQFNAPDITIPAQSGFSSPIGIAIAL